MRQLAQTDGAVLIDDAGVLYRFGAILQLTTRSEHLAASASMGSRSQAASRFALEHPNQIVVKVSADGPIAIFESGERLAEC